MQVITHCEETDSTCTVVPAQTHWPDSLTLCSASDRKEGEIERKKDPLHFSHCLIDVEKR